MKWLKRIGLIVGVLVLLLAAVPFFISVNDYIPEIEKAASERLKEPVKIEKLRLVLLPVPHLTADGITVGKTADVSLGKVTVTPDLWSLLASTRVIRSIEIDKLILTQQGMDKIPLWLGTDPESKEPPAVRVQSVKLDDATLKLAKTTFGPFDARLRLTDAGVLDEASLTGRDGKLKAVIKPHEKDKYLVDAAAKSWKPPIGPAILFDELNVKGVMTLKDANLTDLRAKLYGGVVAGKLTASWTKGIQVKGSLDINQVEIRPMLQAIGRPATLSGRLTAKPVFSGGASTPEQLISALRIETPFDVQNGVVYGVDVAKAATSLIGKDGGKGGETRFDKLSGHLVQDRGTRRLTKLSIVSGSLSADGSVTISPRDQLSGRVNASVKAVSIVSATVPLNVAGTVQDPVLYPTGGTIAGAAIGTAIAGPLGTGVGAKVGQWAEGLFGGGKEEKKKK
jgi:uncharacterized protein involved in outer membrane biogenesis